MTVAGVYDGWTRCQWLHLSCAVAAMLWQLFCCCIYMCVCVCVARWNWPQTQREAGSNTRESIPHEYSAPLNRRSQWCTKTRAVWEEEVVHCLQCYGMLIAALQCAFCGNIVAFGLLYVMWNEYFRSFGLLFICQYTHKSRRNYQLFTVRLLLIHQMIRCMHQTRTRKGTRHSAACFAHT